MEELLRELLAVNQEILNEIKLLRRDVSALSRSGDEGAHDAPPAMPSRQELAEPAGFEETPRPKAAPPRITSSDLEDIGNSLLEGIKKRNRDKSNAFSEFEKRHKNW